MSEHTVAMPLSGEEVVEAMTYELKRRLYRDCHLNPALAYASFEATISGSLRLKDNGREEAIVFDIVLADRPPNVVRQASDQPIPTLVEDSAGKKELKSMRYAKAQTTPDPPPKPGTGHESDPHPSGAPEHEKHEKERKEPEEREKKESKRP